MTVTAVVVCHKDKAQLLKFLECLDAQTKKPDQVILCVCCMDINDLDADIIVRDIHRDDVGQSKCDEGLRLSTSEYTFLASSDDYYKPEFIEQLSKYDTDLILGGFHSHLVGPITNSRPILGLVTRGSFLVRTQKAVEVGYNYRTYDGDGLFIMDMHDAGATWANDPEILYIHN